MSKAIVGAAELAGAAALGTAAFFNPALIANPWFDKALAGLALAGISSEVGAISQALTSGRGINITDRKPASYRQIIYGTQMVGGNLIYESVTGHQYNQVIVIAGHEIHSIQGIFLDGRKVIFTGSGVGWTVRNGVGFGGNALDHDEIGPDGVTHYNFGGKVYVEARYGDQAFSDYMGSINGNDPAWGPKENGDCPSLVGCTYIYLKCTASSQFPQRPEVRILVNGKSVVDPRTGNTAFSNNAALLLADVISDPQYGLGDNSINTAQWIAAANICDEQVAIAALDGTTESRYACDYTYDTGSAPADVMSAMLTGMAGRISYVGGEWFIFPGTYVGPNLTFDQSALTADVQWNPARSVRDLPNRVTGTHVSAEYPYSVFGNYYQNKQEVQNNFDMKFTQSSYPYYAQDQLHGYPNNQWLTQDGGRIRPMELGLPTVLSVTQCQRVAKINLLRQRAKQGSGTLEMSLGAYRLQPCDTFDMTFPQMNWENEVLEVTGTSLSVSTDAEAPSIRYSVNVQQTDPSIYAWSTVEELTVLASAAAPSQTPLIPQSPTNMHLFSGAGTAIVGQDGSVTPVIEVTWDTPLDNAAVGILIQYQPVGGSTWFSAPTADISINIGLISTVIAGQSYDVRIATVRGNGDASEFVEQDNFLVPTLETYLGSLGPIVYTGMSNNLVPNGDFLLGDLRGWDTAAATYRAENGGMVLTEGGHAFSPTFAVQPGQKYRIKITGSVAVDGTRIVYHRIFYGTTYGPNISDLPAAGYQGLFDFLQAGNMNNLTTTYTYDWTCPPDTHYASIALYQLGTAQPVFSHVVVQDYSAAAEWGADVTEDQPVVYAGISGNLIPNGDFLLRNIQGWFTAPFGTPEGSAGYDSNSNSIDLQNYMVASPTFAIQPGNKYRFTFNAAVARSGSGSSTFYLRVYWGDHYSPNITDFIAGSSTGLLDFVSNSDLPTGFTAHTFDWTAPSGASFASLSAFASGADTLVLKNAVAQDYAAAAQWGADVTGSNTSADTAAVSGVPAQVIANVVPNGFKVILNTGNRTYSIQAI
jgi:hypothetical protein